MAMLKLLKLFSSKYFRHTIDNRWLPPEWSILALELLAPYTVNVHASMYERTPKTYESLFQWRFPEGSKKSELRRTCDD